MAERPPARANGRRGHRRATSTAYDTVRGIARDDLPEAGDERAPDEPGAGQAAAEESARDRWLREQRPPHWG